MVETPDGHGRLELTKFHTPVGPGRRPARAGESGRMVPMTRVGRSALRAAAPAGRGHYRIG